MQLCSTIFGLAALAISVQGFDFKLVNKVGTIIYVYSSNHLGKSSPEVKLANGATYTSPYPLENDSKGITIKAAWEPSYDLYRPSYQVEVSMKSGVLWYNFSGKEGNVFQNVARTLGGGGCEVKHCDAGSLACDWYPCGADGKGDCNIAACTPIPGQLVAVLGE